MKPPQYLLRLLLLSVPLVAGVLIGVNWYQRVRQAKLAHTNYVKTVAEYDVGLRTALAVCEASKVWREAQSGVPFCDKTAVYAAHADRVRELERKVEFCILLSGSYREERTDLKKQVTQYRIEAEAALSSLGR